MWIFCYGLAQFDVIVVTNVSVWKRREWMGVICFCAVNELCIYYLYQTIIVQLLLSNAIFLAAAAMLL